MTRSDLMKAFLMLENQPDADGNPQPPLKRVALHFSADLANTVYGITSTPRHVDSKATGGVTWDLVERPEGVGQWALAEVERAQ